MHISKLPKIEAVLKVSGKAEFVVMRRAELRKFVESAGMTGFIDESDYLRRYPDVARAVQEGVYSSATEHYIKAGYSEQRTATIIPEPVVRVVRSVR